MTRSYQKDGQQGVRGIVNIINMGQDTMSHSSTGGMMRLNISCDILVVEKTMNEGRIFFSSIERSMGRAGDTLTNRGVYSHAAPRSNRQAFRVDLTETIVSIFHFFRRFIQRYILFHQAPEI